MVLPHIGIEAALCMQSMVSEVERENKFNKLRFMIDQYFELIKALKLGEIQAYGMKLKLTSKLKAKLETRAKNLKLEIKSLVDELVEE